MSSATPSAVGAGAVVRFEATRRPETAAHVTLEAWEGPLGLLLSLIEFDFLVGGTSPPPRAS